MHIENMRAAIRDISILRRDGKETAVDLEKPAKPNHDPAVAEAAPNVVAAHRRTHSRKFVSISGSTKAP